MNKPIFINLSKPIFSIYLILKNWKHGDVAEWNRMWLSHHTSWNISSAILKMLLLRHGEALTKLCNNKILSNLIYIFRGNIHTQFVMQNIKMMFAVQPTHPHPKGSGVTKYSFCCKTYRYRRKNKNYKRPTYYHDNFIWPKWEI